MKQLLLLNVIVGMLFFQSSFAQEPEKIEITHGPYLQNLTDSSVTIMFSTNQLVVPGVHISQEEGESKLIRNSKDGLFNVGSNLHKVQIDGLTPGRSYDYQLDVVPIQKYRPYEVVYGEPYISSSFSFQTHDVTKEQVHFTVFCDLHDKPGKLLKYLESNDVEKQDAYFFNGDIMGHLEEEKQLFHSFIDPAVEVFASFKPFYYVRGNHETRGQFARNLKSYLDLPEDEYYYARTIGPVRFIMLDGGEDKPDSTSVYAGLADFDAFRLKELEWLKKEIKTEAFKEAAFRVVIIHMPIMEHKKNWHGMAFLAEHFGPVLQEAGIDLMLSGHTHRNAWVKVEKSGFAYPILISSNNNYIEAMASDRQIWLKLKDIEGKVVEEYVVDKK
jgi:predicted phosphodiesterase